MALGGVLIVSNVDVLDDFVGVYAERLLLGVHLLCKSSGGFDITVLLEELQHKSLDEVPFLEW